MLAIRLDADLERRLTELAAKTGRTKTFYARAAIEAHLEELEDYFLAEERVANFRPEKSVSLESLKAELDRNV
ncbi:TraY domain-containing protein [Sphingorhabdus contaminans]|uniref:Relaxosome protein TraY n=2 Tax=Sphingorhabdus contaminans TaxID=1343899 RepID=A0A553WD11_9SPHN|nr:TraY domain-containing protein [Sphingorhabdus contaminans]